jgi:hypothetical protein
MYTVLAMASYRDDVNRGQLAGLTTFSCAEGDIFANLMIENRNIVQR